MRICPDAAKQTRGLIGKETKLSLLEANRRVERRRM
jgi:hypothetical protein